MRARERLFPPGERVVDDPFAEAFLRAAGSGLLRPLSALGRRLGLDGLASLKGRVLGFAFDRPLVGLGPFLVARHRAIDDFLIAECKAGATQCVILGAGYDSRAYRFPPPLGPARHFEVDLPALSMRKRELVRTVVSDGLGAHVRFVACDFEREGFDEKLLAAGFDRGARTVFVWEGVVYYLTRDAVEATLRKVRDLSGPRSTVIFDLWRRPEGFGPLDPVRRALPRLFLRAAREPIRSWFDDPAEPEGLLRRLGFEPALHLRRDDLQKLYVDHSRGRRGGTVGPHLEVAAGRARVG